MLTVSAAQANLKFDPHDGDPRDALHRSLPGVVLFHQEMGDIRGLPDMELVRLRINDSDAVDQIEP